MKEVNPPTYRTDTVLPLPMEVRADAWAVDAACSGNPGPMEYQAIDLQTDEIDNKVQAIVDLFPPVSDKISVVGLPNRTGGQVVENRFCVVVSVNYVAY